MSGWKLFLLLPRFSAWKSGLYLLPSYCLFIFLLCQPQQYIFHTVYKYPTSLSAMLMALFSTCAPQLCSQQFPYTDFISGSLSGFTNSCPPTVGMDVAEKPFLVTWCHLVFPPASLSRLLLLCWDSQCDSQGYFRSSFHRNKRDHVQFWPLLRCRYG